MKPRARYIHRPRPNVKNYLTRYDDMIVMESYFLIEGDDDFTYGNVVCKKFGKTLINRVVPISFETIRLMDLITGDKRTGKFLVKKKEI